MLVERDLKKIWDLLVHDDVVRFSIDDSEITIRPFGETSKAVFSTPVYLGDNFIPISVRKCAHQKQQFKGPLGIKTSISIDENKYQISLVFLDDLDKLTHHEFNHLISEFAELANQWRTLLDENDRNDLVYVRAKT